MTRHSHIALLAAALIGWTGLAVAQTETPKPDPTAPSAASSPHQRSSTATDAAEAPATSGTDPASSATPHQKQATAKMTPQQQQAMKDCMKKQQAQDSSLSKDDVKKACMQQMQTKSE